MRDTIILICATASGLSLIAIIALMMLADRGLSADDFDDGYQGEE